MGLEYHRTGSGLVVANQGSDEAAVRRALKQFDPDLRLVPQDSDHFGRRIYKVYLHRGGDRPAEFLCGWWDEHGQPFPLSMALLDKVQRLRKDTRAPFADVDKHNAELTQRKRQEESQAAEDAAEDWQFKHGRTILHRSVGLRQSRDRRRARGENV